MKRMLLLSGAMVIGMGMTAIVMAASQEDAAMKKAQQDLEMVAAEAKADPSPAVNTSPVAKPSPTAKPGMVKRLKDYFDGKKKGSQSSQSSGAQPNAAPSVVPSNAPNPRVCSQVQEQIANIEARIADSETSEDNKKLYKIQLDNQIVQRKGSCGQ